MEQEYRSEEVQDDLLDDVITLLNAKENQALQ